MEFSEGVREREDERKAQRKDGPYGLAGYSVLGMVKRNKIKGKNGIEREREKKDREKKKERNKE